MKQTFAVGVCAGCTGCVVQAGPEAALPLRGAGGGSSGGGCPAQPGSQSLDPQSELMRRYENRPEAERALRRRVADRFRQTAVAVERTDGLRGLRLLDRLDLEAVYLYEKHPKEFRRLRDVLDDDSAAEVLLHWRSTSGSNEPMIPIEASWSPSWPALSRQPAGGALSRRVCR